MPTVEMTPHLYRFFPILEDREIKVRGESVAEIIGEVNKIASGFSNYIINEHGALRRHVFVAVNDSIVIDRQTLSDHVPEDATVFIFQALTGG